MNCENPFVEAGHAGSCQQPHQCCYGHPDPARLPKGLGNSRVPLGVSSHPSTSSHCPCLSRGHPAVMMLQRTVAHPYQWGWGRRPAPQWPAVGHQRAPLRARRDPGSSDPSPPLRQVRKLLLVPGLCQPRSRSYAVFPTLEGQSPGRACCDARLSGAQAWPSKLWHLCPVPGEVFTLLPAPCPRYA